MSAAGRLALDILTSIDSMDVDSLAKKRFKQLVVAVSELHEIDCVARANRSEFALQLLHAEVSRAAVRDRLIAKYHISRAHAYRVLQIALQRKSKPETVSKILIECDKGKV